MSEQGPTVFNGRYELLRHIARGGMADVYLARDELLDREVALKVLFPEFANDPSFVERFRREAQAAANLNHPNIVGVYDWGQERGTYYIVMEYVAGRSMADVIRSTGPLHPDRAAEIAADVAAALVVAHEAGIVHRDVKLGNILIADDGNVKVADFGIATALVGAAEDGLTQHGSVMGTATYFSPEQAQGKPLDGRSDLYSLGVVLYEMLSGTPPFQADTPVGVAYKHVQEKPESLGERGVNLAQSLEAITMKLLAKNPANRYPAASDLKSDLSRYLAGAHKIPGSAAAAAAAAATAAAATPSPAAAESAPPTQVVPVQPAAADSQAAIASQYPSGFAYYDDEPPRQDDWKRTVGLVVGLALLVGVLGFLVVAFAKTMGFGDGADDPGPTTETAVEIPQLIGDLVDDARAELIDLDLDIEIDFATNNVIPVDEVFEQSPPAGRRVEPGQVVTVTVSSGSATSVPGVVGQTLEVARSLLEERGYVVQTLEEDSPFEAGTIVTQDPVAGTELNSGQPVVITISLGPASVPIPDVSGKSVVVATTQLQDAGLRPDTQTEEASDTIPAGDVIGTIPEAGNLVDANSPITVVVSTGVPQVQVPAVENLLVDVASTRLVNEGLVPQLTFQEVPFGSADVDRVISQSPAAFVEVNVGEIVTIVVGEAAAAPTTTVAPTTTAAPTTTVPPATTAPPTTTVP